MENQASSQEPAEKPEQTQVHDASPKVELNTNTDLQTATKTSTKWKKIAVAIIVAIVGGLLSYYASTSLFQGNSFQIDYKADKVEDYFTADAEEVLRIKVSKLEANKDIYKKIWDTIERKYLEKGYIEQLFPGQKAKFLSLNRNAINVLAAKSNKGATSLVVSETNEKEVKKFFADLEDKEFQANLFEVLSDEREAAEPEPHDTEAHEEETHDEQEEDKPIREEEKSIPECPDGQELKEVGHEVLVCIDIEKQEEKVEEVSEEEIKEAAEPTMPAPIRTINLTAAPVIPRDAKPKVEESKTEEKDKIEPKVETARTSNKPVNQSNNSGIYCKDASLCAAYHGKFLLVAADKNGAAEFVIQKAFKAANPENKEQKLIQAPEYLKMSKKLKRATSGLVSKDVFLKDVKEIAEYDTKKPTAKESKPKDKFAEKSEAETKEKEGKITKEEVKVEEVEINFSTQPEEGKQLSFGKNSKLALKAEISLEGDSKSINLKAIEACNKASGAKKCMPVAGISNLDLEKEVKIKGSSIFAAAKALKTKSGEQIFFRVAYTDSKGEAAYSETKQFEADIELIAEEKVEEETEELPLATENSVPEKAEEETKEETEEVPLATESSVPEEKPSTQGPAKLIFKSSSQNPESQVVKPSESNFEALRFLMEAEGAQVQISEITLGQMAGNGADLKTIDGKKSPQATGIPHPTDQLAGIKLYEGPGFKKMIGAGLVKNGVIKIEDLDIEITPGIKKEIAVKVDIRADGKTGDIFSLGVKDANAKTKDDSAVEVVTTESVDCKTTINLPNEYKMKVSSTKPCDDLKTGDTFMITKGVDSKSSEVMQKIDEINDGLKMFHVLRSGYGELSNIGKYSTSKEGQVSKLTAAGQPMFVRDNQPKFTILPVSNELENGSDKTVFKFNVKGKGQLNRLLLHVDGSVAGKKIGSDYGTIKTDNPSKVNGFETDGTDGIASWTSEGKDPVINFSKAYLWDTKKKEKVEDVKIYYGNTDTDYNQVAQSFLVIDPDLDLTKDGNTYELRGTISGLNIPVEDYMSFWVHDPAEVFEYQSFGQSYTGGELIKYANSKEKALQSTLSIATPPSIHENIIWSQGSNWLNGYLLEDFDVEVQKLRLKKAIDPNVLMITTSPNTMPASIVLGGTEDLKIATFNVQGLDEEVIINSLTFGLGIFPSSSQDDYIKNIKLYNSKNLLTPIATKPSVDNNKIKFTNLKLSIPAEELTKIVLTADIEKVGGAYKTGAGFFPAIQFATAKKAGKSIDVEEKTTLATCDAVMRISGHSTSKAELMEGECNDIKAGDVIYVKPEYVAIQEKYLSEDGKTNYKIVRKMFGSKSKNHGDFNIADKGVKKLNAVGKFMVLRQAKPIISTVESTKSLESGEGQTIYQFEVKAETDDSTKEAWRNIALSRLVFELDGQLAGNPFDSQLDDFELHANGKKLDVTTELYKTSEGMSYAIADFNYEEIVDEDGRKYELKADINGSIKSGDFLSVKIPNTIGNLNESYYTPDSGMHSNKVITASSNAIKASKIPNADEYSEEELEEMTEEELAEIITEFELFDDVIWTDRATGGQGKFLYKNGHWTNGYLLKSLETISQTLTY